MNILLAFTPFIAFAVVDRLAGATTGLACGAAVAAILFLRDLVTPGRRLKVLEIGTVILFGGLAIYSQADRVEWTIIGVRLCVDAGLLAIVLISMAIRQPFTLQYARETVPAEFWGQPEFLRTNYVITAVWAAAFAAMVGADLLMLDVPTVPLRVGIWVTVIALVGAIKFTDWYSKRNEKQPEA